MPLKDLIDQLKSPSEGLDLTRLGVSTQPFDVRATSEALLKIQDQLLDQLASGNRSLVVTETAQEATAKGPASGLAQESWGHQAVGRQRWDAVATWLDLNGVLSTARDRPMTGRIWRLVLTPSPETSDASIGAALGLQERLHRRMLATPPGTYRREMLATLSALHAVPPDAEPAVLARAQTCRAWTDALLDARPLAPLALTLQEALALPGPTLGPAVQAHLTAVEQRQLRAVAEAQPPTSNPSASPRSRL